MHDATEGLALGLAHHPVRTILVIVIGMILFIALMERFMRDPAPPRLGGSNNQRLQQQRPKEKLAMRRRRLD